MMTISKPYPPTIQRLLERLHFTALDEWGSTTRYRFRCPEGHELCFTKETLYEVKGCRLCRKNEQMLRLQRKAKQNGSELLDTQWVEPRRQYRFRCLRNPNHEWQRSYSYAVANSRCPHCSPKGPKLLRDGLERMQEYARGHGGECLSPEYLGVTRKHRFRCAKGHIWEVVAGDAMRKDSWCYQCKADGIRHGIEEVHRIVGERGGQFLSDEYQNSKTPYT
ncbi:hypothetical protein ACQCLI_13785 [Pseudomonas nitroreducens]|uniref:hypothetical protein n=1 Tax=Pseudomonas nitroreducens TaxID=46680 RepID=UPI0012FE201E|nr:hypothetical protein [Pseudomonas nitroreducens]